jgi:hypothetical protein
MRTIRIDRLVGRLVYTANNRRLGRIEEVCAESRDGRTELTEYVIGSVGLLQRLHVGIQLLLNIKRAGGYRARWDQLDVTTPDRPRLRCSVSELKSG